jgi:NADPH-dependent 7-cyano-7-deazaguanine reductase QueF
MDTRNNISLNRYSSQVDWEQEYATYTGDSRALDNRYLAMIQNTNRRRLPNKDEILNELYEKIYPQVKNYIYNKVR